MSFESAETDQEAVAVKEVRVAGKAMAQLGTDLQGPCPDLGATPATLSCSLLLIPLLSSPMSLLTKVNHYRKLNWHFSAKCERKLSVTAQI